MDKKITIDKRDLGMAFLTPPENQGQMVDISYSCTEDYILKRTEDRSDRTLTIVAYHYPADGSEDNGIEPWQAVPKLGRRASLVELR